MSHPWHKQAYDTSCTLCMHCKPILNVILLPKFLRNAPDLSSVIYSLLIRKLSGLSPRQLVEVVLPWVPVRTKMSHRILSTG